MPYDANAELPKPVRDHLPEHAQTIYGEALNHAWQQYAQDPAHEEIAHRVAGTLVLSARSSLLELQMWWRRFAGARCALLLVG